MKPSQLQLVNRTLLTVIIILSQVGRAIAQAPYDQYILTPRSRTVRPVSVYNINGTVNGAETLLEQKASAIGNATRNATFQGPSAVTYDFGKAIGGIASFSIVARSSDPESFVGISFTQSNLWINSEGCDATADAGIDKALWWNVGSSAANNSSVAGPTRYEAEPKYQRGAFRYLNVYYNGSSSSSVALNDLSIYFTAVPQIEDEADLGKYTGYFYSSDVDNDQLNRIWYAGAYTNELCTIDPRYGDMLNYFMVITSNSTVDEPLEWWSNHTITNGSSTLVDGAARDRLVWPGDLAIQTPSIVVSTYEIDSLRNALDSLLMLQNPDGSLPYVGLPLAIESPIFSFTYHLYSLIAIYDNYLYTGNETYLADNWDHFKRGLNYSISFIDDSGLANVTSSADWLRFGMGGHNIEANAILYHTLNLGITLAEVLNDTSVATSGSNWSSIAAAIKLSAYDRLWDASANLYRDNDTLPLISLHPQDGNSWAIISNLTTSPEQASNISLALSNRWTNYGAPAPEAGATISPFISSFELQAHYIARHPSLAIQLTKLMWGDFMLDDPRMTNSTFIEGYSTDGSLHYAPYTNDPRVSHAHGWATGPTSALTFYAAGLQIISAGGTRWKIAPNLGDQIRNVEAGYSTTVGNFSIQIMKDQSIDGLEIEFSTPVDTIGSVELEHPGNGVRGNMTVIDVMGLNDDIVVSFDGNSSSSSSSMASSLIVAEDVPGGWYRVVLTVERTDSTVLPPYESSAAVGRSNLPIEKLGLLMLLALSLDFLF